MANANVPSVLRLSGVTLRMYVDAIYVSKYQDKDDNTKYGFYMIAKKRRDVDPFSPTAGQYITNIGFSPKKAEGDEPQVPTNIFHGQPIGRKILDKILEVNDIEPIQDKYIQLAAETHRALINRRDNVCFDAVVATDPRHTIGFRGIPTYIVRVATLKFSDYQFKWAAKEEKWETLATEISAKLDKLLLTEAPDVKTADNFGSEYMKFRQRPDFPKGQYKFPNNTQQQVSNQQSENETTVLAPLAPKKGA